MTQSIKKPHLLNGATLAYIGDAVYEVAIREHLLQTGLTKPNDLHRKATNYVSAKSQASLIQAMEAKGILTADEIDIYKRGRNTKIYTKAKNADHATYSKSTGFEAVIGYIYLNDEIERMDELINWCIKEIEEA